MRADYQENVLLSYSSAQLQMTNKASDLLQLFFHHVDFLSLLMPGRSSIDFKRERAKPGQRQQQHMLRELGQSAGLCCSAASQNCFADAALLYIAFFNRGLMLPPSVSKHYSANAAAPAHWLLTSFLLLCQHCTFQVSHLFLFLPSHFQFTRFFLLFFQCSLPSINIYVGKLVALVIRLLQSFIDHWTSRLESPESLSESLLQ